MSIFSTFIDISRAFVKWPKYRQPSQHQPHQNPHPVRHRILPIAKAIAREVLQYFNQNPMSKLETPGKASTANTAKVPNAMAC